MGLHNRPVHAISGRAAKRWKALRYGPFSVDGDHVSESNRSFDASLRERNPAWGVRDQTTVMKQACEEGLTLQNITLMPSNNRMITWVR